MAMMTLVGTERLRNRWALVTGASSGIGAAFARLLAEAGMNLVLVARREDRLKALAAELEQVHGVRVRVESVDLVRPGAIAALHRRTTEAGLEIDLLVNNAGFGLYGRHFAIEWEHERELLELDVLAVAEMTKRYVADMLARDLGWVIQVASIGAYQPTPSYAVYSAAKAFVLSLGEALAWELRSTGVNVSVLSPGITESEFFSVAGQSPGLYHRLTCMSAERAASVGLRAVLRGRPSVLPGVVNNLGAFATRLVPRRLQAAIAWFAMNAGSRADRR